MAISSLLELSESPRPSVGLFNLCVAEFFFNFWRGHLTFSAGHYNLFRRLSIRLIQHFSRLLQHFSMLLQSLQQIVPGFSAGYYNLFSRLLQFFQQVIAIFWTDCPSLFTRLLPSFQQDIPAFSAGQFNYSSKLLHSFQQIIAIFSASYCNLFSRSCQAFQQGTQSPHPKVALFPF